MKSLAPTASFFFYSHCNWSGFADVLSLCVCVGLCVYVSMCVDHFQFIFQRGVVRHQNWTRPKQWNNPRLTDWLGGTWRQNSFSLKPTEFVDACPCPSLPLLVLSILSFLPLLLFCCLFPLFHFTRSPFHHQLRLWLCTLCVFNVVKQLEQTENLG